jgi:hypothetical protein
MLARAAWLAAVSAVGSGAGDGSGRLLAAVQRKYVSAEKNPAKNAVKPKATSIITFGKVEPRMNVMLSFTCQLQVGAVCARLGDWPDRTGSAPGLLRPD